MSQEVAYHVCSWGKLKKYERSGYILGPVRAWKTLAEAERFRVSTGRRLIIAIPLGIANWHPLAGHKGLALVTQQSIPWPLRGEESKGASNIDNHIYGATVCKSS